MAGLIENITNSAKLKLELELSLAKTLLRDNVGSDGNLVTDKVAKALLGCRNTPNVELKRSLAQLLYSRNLRVHLPGRKEVMDNEGMVDDT